MIAALACLLLAAGGAANGPVANPDLSSALDALPTEELVVVQDPAARPSRVLLATRIRARAPWVQSRLTDPATYRAAVPALSRAEILSPAAKGSPVSVGWELEVPLWNLEGKLWLIPTADGVDLRLSEGDLAPGHLRLSAVPDRNDTTLLIIDARLNMRDVNWATRRLAGRSPVAEPAMAVSTAYVLLRAVRLATEGGSASDSRRRPQARMFGPLHISDGTALGEWALRLLKRPAAAATVRSRPDGRLDSVQVAVLARISASSGAALLNQPSTFQALPGWREVQAGVNKPAACAAETSRCWRVRSNLPFVDLDATWKLERSFGARAVAGDVAGAVLACEVVPGPGVSATVLTLHPRLDKSGYVPRKLIEAEPLLEHGMALGLALADALSLARAMEAHGEQ